MTEDHLLGEQIRQEKQAEETLAWIEKILDSLKIRGKGRNHHLRRI